jgi:hypothetical protein
MQATGKAKLVTGMNNGLRTAMDLMVRDMLQVGQGLPTGRVILVPSGANGHQYRGGHSVRGCGAGHQRHRH